MNFLYLSHNRVTFDVDFFIVWQRLAALQLKHCDQQKRLYCETNEQSSSLILHQDEK